MRPALALALAAVVLPGLLGAGCQTRQSPSGGGRAEATADTTITVALGTRQLVLDGFAGDVTLTADSSARAVTVRLTRRARGATDASAAERLRHIAVRQGSDAEMQQVVWRADEGDGLSADAVVTLPAGADVVVRLGAGNVMGTGLAGRLDAESGAGNVRLTGLRAQALRVHLGAGNADVSAAAIPPGARWAVDLGAGNVSLALPQAATADVDVETSAGTLDADGLALSDAQRTGGPAGGRVRGRLGVEHGSAATVRAETAAGNVTLRAAR